MSTDDEMKKLVDMLFDAREKLPNDLRIALAQLDIVDEESAAMLQMSIGKLLALGASKKIVELGVEAMFAVDAMLRK